MQASTAQKQAVEKSDPLVANLAGFLHHVWRFCGSGGGFLEAIDELGLSLSQLKAMQLLSTTQDPELSLKQLGDALGLSLPAISRAVDSLVQRGLVTRTEDSTDRRMKRVRTTKAGDEIVDHLVEIRFTELAKYVEVLSPPEREKLGAALDALRESGNLSNLSAHKESPDA
jgi:DNA-binding MarR family transcriptional regulator